MKKKGQFKTLYCPRCKRNTKHRRVDDIEITSDKRIVFRGWVCKKCGKVITEPKELVRIL